MILAVHGAKVVRCPELFMVPNSSSPGTNTNAMPPLGVVRKSRGSMTFIWTGPEGTSPCFWPCAHGRCGRACHRKAPQPLVYADQVDVKVVHVYLRNVQNAHHG